MSRHLVWLGWWTFLGVGLAQTDPLPQGNFVYRSEVQDVEFQLRLPSMKPGKPVRIPFSASTLSGRGPAAEGVLEGIPGEDAWGVTFRDDFGNTGRGTVRLKPGLVFLTLKLERAEEPRCARFYGSMRLVRER